MTAASKHVGAPPAHEETGPDPTGHDPAGHDAHDAHGGEVHVPDACASEPRADLPRAHQPGADYSAAGELLRALAAPLRIAIVVELNAAPRCVHELVDALDAPQPLISQHLKVLRSAGVVVGERRGREVVYSLADTHVAHIVTDAVSHSREGR